MRAPLWIIPTPVGRVTCSGRGLRGAAWTAAAPPPASLLGCFHRLNAAREHDRRLALPAQSKRRLRPRILLPLLAVFILWLWQGSSLAETNAVEVLPRAKLQVSGFGLLENRNLRWSLRELQVDRETTAFDANFIEDVFLILHNRLADDGYLNSMVVANLTLTNGSQLSVWWDGHEELQVPRDVRVPEARFEVIRGVLHFYDRLVIEGLTSMTETMGRGFFITRDSLLNLKTMRRFSMSHLQSSMRNLRRELVNRGYRDAVVRLKERQIDSETGEVQVAVEVIEGPRYTVRHLKVTCLDPESEATIDPVSIPEDQPFSMAWEQDAAQSINLQLYRQGYADARTRIREIDRFQEGNQVRLDLEAEVTIGQPVALGAVRFKGANHTRESFLKRRITLEGPLLDRVEADQARERLARLGSFRFVDLQLEPDTGSPRDVVYELTEGKRYDLSLIAGYGSYDQLFGGLEFEHFNVWGIGHNTRLKLLQSFKSTHGTYTYTIPEFLAPDLNLFGSADAFQREELTFDRQEVKLSLGLRKQWPRSGHQAGLRYSYEFLDAQTAAVGDEDTRAAAIIADWQVDRRDNPLLPRSGYRVYSNFEFADRALGGQSEYIRFQIGGSYHRPFTRGLVAHIGLLHSVVSSPDRTTLLPFNKRFFPGGDNSVRGFRRGGASPLDAAGEQIGAESVLQWNLELEQNFTRTISIVGFLDGVGITPVIESYPFDEVLWSVGAGVRWNTIIGPVRLEYGHNLNPRQADPDGTLHFSIGFPF